MGEDPCLYSFSHHHGDPHLNLCHQIIHGPSSHVQPGFGIRSLSLRAALYILFLSSLFAELAMIGTRRAAFLTGGGCFPLGGRDVERHHRFSLIHACSPCVGLCACLCVYTERLSSIPYDTSFYNRSLSSFE